MLATELVHENSNGVIPQMSKVGIVQMTGNYKLFKIDTRNRPIDSIHLMRLHDAIERKNLLREYPIVVNAEMKVIDGQHRLKVAESLNIPIYYIISDRVTIEDVATTNSHTRHWRLEDYLHHFCSAGNLEYLKLRRFWEKNNFLALTTAVRLCYYGTGKDGERGGNLSRLFAIGSYMANDIQFAEKVAQACLDFSKYVFFYKETVFVNAIACLMANSEYDHARMMGKMKYLSAKLVKCANIELYMVVFTDIYNYKVRPDSEVVLKKLNPRDARHRADRKLDAKLAAKKGTESQAA